MTKTIFITPLFVVHCLQSQYKLVAGLVAMNLAFFPLILGISIIPIDFHSIIFQRGGRKTTTQIYISTISIIPFISHFISHSLSLEFSPSGQPWVQEKSTKYDRIDPVRHITKRAKELGAGISSLCLEKKCS